MADGGDAYTARTVGSIADIGRARWDSLANPNPAEFNPFTSYDFLSALEESGSVGGGSGWTARHLVLEAAGSAAGVVPLYLKTHSQGEYVFDHHWADAYGRAGGRYYPKLLAGIPFTPVQGPRLLARDAAARAALSRALESIAAQSGVSSLHVNFLPAEEVEALSAAGFMPRIGVQYHWFNRGYRDFDGFLSALTSRKRKAIKRERREVAASGLHIRTMTGAEIDERSWEAMWAFYQDTGARKWGRPYLTRAFFTLIGERMADKVLLILAKRNGRPVAGALNFIGGEALYGRYWGCLEAHDFLHFELCYHRAIDYAIAHRLSRVEAGAQGEHKIARGYEPVETRSAHWIADPGFRSAIAAYLERERAGAAEDIEALASMSPFKEETD